MKFRPAIVAHIDVLGARNFLLECDENKADGLIDVANYIVGKNTFMAHRKKSEIFFRVFSDNFFIGAFSSRRSGNFTHAMWNIISYTRLIQSQLFDFYGLLTRGGIADGLLYKDKVICCGSALVKAYEIETKTAIYPRVVISPELTKAIQHKDNLPNQGKHHDLNLKSHLIMDYDGETFIDYLTATAGDGERGSRECWRNIAEYGVKNAKALTIPHNATKYEWLLRYGRKRLNLPQGEVDSIIGDQFPMLDLSHTP